MVGSAAPSQAALAGGVHSPRQDENSHGRGLSTSHVNPQHSLSIIPLHRGRNCSTVALTFPGAGRWVRRCCAILFHLGSHF